MAQADFDLVVIGSGPGGYVGAIRAAQLGLKTAVIEKDPTFGGTCLNVGCIPSKALLQSSENYEALVHEFKEHGIEAQGVQLNLPQMLARKDKIVKELTGGIVFLFKKHKIESFQGWGRIAGANTVEVLDPKGNVSSTLNTKSIMIATGSVPVALPFLPFDGETVVTSTEALSFQKVPEHLIVVGGGVIGLELGSVWRRLGAKVSVFEFADRIAGVIDSQLGRDYQRILKKQGLEFYTSTKVTGAEKRGSQVVIRYESVKDGSGGEMVGDKILVSVGRKPFTEGLGLEKVGIKTDERGRIAVNEHYQTNVPNIFAIGDVIQGPMLAHKAEEEGVAVAEIISTGYGHVNYECVPSVIYTWPEYASVGRTEDELKASGASYKSGIFSLVANGRAKALGHPEGKVKVLADAKTDRILGVHILAPNASEMIAEAVVAMEFGGSAEDLARSFHAHPTLAESIREAALAVDGRQRQS